MSFPNFDSYYENDEDDSLTPAQERELHKEMDPDYYRDIEMER